MQRKLIRDKNNPMRGIWFNLCQTCKKWESCEQELSPGTKRSVLYMGAILRLVTRVREAKEETSQLAAGAMPGMGALPKLPVVCPNYPVAR